MSTAVLVYRMLSTGQVLALRILLDDSGTVHFEPGEDRSDEALAFLKDGVKPPGGVCISR